mmetsp:Transcript_5216/g.21050  ORF Transcript_5216/g.21050 Transcript_5216/m.21050 type:complete len:285 (-) Transcript_5216:406-1260(-)
MSSSVFMRREASCSPPAPPRSHISASISSMNTTDGARKRASSNNTRTSFSESPRYLETTVDAETLKKTHFSFSFAPDSPPPDSVATAFASMVFPVPGGPCSRTPRQGRSRPVNSAGYRNGATTASRRIFLATARPATSSHRTSGDPTYTSRRMTRASALRSSEPKSTGVPESGSGPRAGASANRTRDDVDAASRRLRDAAPSPAPTPTTPKSLSGAWSAPLAARAVALPTMGAIAVLVRALGTPPFRAPPRAPDSAPPTTSVFVFSESSSRALPSRPAGLDSRV